MHAWLAFIIGVLTALGGFLFFSAFAGVALYGLALQVEVAIAASLLVVAGIVTYIFYVGLTAQFKKVKTGREALVGSKGIATSDLKPRGEIRVQGEFWQATAKDTEISVGQPVMVVGMEGMFLVVKPLAAQEEKA
jgi:membrane-bound ClpP family serine protease